MSIEARVLAVRHPKLVCANCSHGPLDHAVRNERLTCADGQEWRYTQDYQVADLIRRIDQAEALASSLRSKLFWLVEGR